MTPNHMMSRIGPVAFAIILLAAPMPAQQASPVDEVAGRWRGASTCVKADWNAACNDETVVYWFERKSDTAATLSAYKYVGKMLENMGDLDVTYDPSKKSWNAHWSNERFVLLWTFQVLPHGLITGRLLDVRAGRVGRTIRVQRDSIQVRPSGH
jgi:hypothetical protein